MPVTRPTLAEINSRTQADLASRVDGSSPGLRRSLIRALATAVSGAINGLYGFVQAISLECNPYTAVRTLPQWASLWLGPNPQKQPGTATGPAIATGSPSAPIPDGTPLQSSLGVEYLTVGDATIGSGSTVSLTLIALNEGSDGNQAAGATLTFVSPLLGVDANVTVDTAGIGGGADLETIDSLRARMLQRIQNPPHGGNAADYEAWALSVSPITRAWVFPTYSGAGTVRVYVANDAYVGPTAASAGDVAAAAAYIESQRPLGAVIASGGSTVTGVTTMAATLQPVNFTLSDSPDNPNTRAAIIQGLTELFAREAAPEGKIPIHHILGTIYNAAGVYDFTLTSPTVDQVAAAGNILSLGSVTFS